MKLTPEIIEAIRKKTAELGSIEAFAAEVGIGRPTIYKYITGTIKKVHPLTWKRLHPFISEHLPEQERGGILQIGNIVKLKSGGPPMTVDMIIGARTCCVWFFDGQQFSSVFHADALKKITPEE